MLNFQVQPPLALQMQQHLSCLTQEYVIPQPLRGSIKVSYLS